jgi:hypothetical protein
MAANYFMVLFGIMIDIGSAFKRCFLKEQHVKKSSRKDEDMFDQKGIPYLMRVG